MNTATTNIPTASTSVSQGAPTPPTGRSRQQSRKRVVADDAAYRGEGVLAPISVGAKRTAADRADGEPRKRKRADHSVPLHVQATIASATIAAKQAKQGDAGESSNSGAPFFEFAKMPSSALYRYITHHDLVPGIFPSPLSAEDPPPPSCLLDPSKRGIQLTSPVTTAPATVTITPANRPRRNKDSHRESGAVVPNRRRSTRSTEDDARFAPEQVPVLADVGEVHNVLAQIAQKHYRESGIKEVETLASFMCAVKAKQGRWR